MTPTQDIALAAVISSGVVGVVGAAAGFIGGWRDRKSTRDLATTERKQQRLADTYVDLLVMTKKVGYWAQKVRPVAEMNPPQPAPELPELDSQMLVNAKVSAYASAEVKARYEEWHKAVEAVRLADLKIGLRQRAADDHRHHTPRAGEDVSWKDWLTPWHELEDTLRPAEAKARQSLEEQVAAELA